MPAGSPPAGLDLDTAILLAIETAGSVCAAAVLRGASLQASESLPMRHGHGEALLPMVDRVVAAAGLRPQQLEVVAAAVGPGGFTGIRVGLAAAHGIALATGARLVGVTNFAAVASATAPLAPECPTLLVALDSRRADLYLQLFCRDPLTPIAPPAAILSEDIPAWIAPLAGHNRLLIAGDASDAAAATLGEFGDFTIAPGSAADALGVAESALAQLRAGDPMPARPLYLRPPDVTMPKPIQQRGRV